MSEAKVVRGYYTGMMDVYIAKMTTPDTTEKAPTYDTPKVLGMGIQVTVSPQYREGSLYASNVAVRRRSEIDRYNVTINVDTVTHDMLAYALDRKADNKNVQIIGGTPTEQEYALGFVRTKDNGKAEYWWLLRGRLVEGEAAAATSNDGITYQTPTLTGTFDRRRYDNNLAVVADSDNSEITEDVFSGWFKTVYEPNKGE